MHFVRHRIRIRILCLAVKIFYISIHNLYLFFEPRPSSAVPKGTPCGGCLAAKTGRGEGGLLCLRN
jgi:hypothetical protein